MKSCVRQPAEATSEPAGMGAATPVSQSGKLQAGLLSTADIVFMVVGAAAPMAVVVALMPLAFAFGTGPGVAGAWLIALAAMLLFAVGYVRIIPYVKNAGAFFAYISISLGPTWGLGAAYVAAMSYFALSCSVLGALTFFAGQLLSDVTGLSPPWLVVALIFIGAIGKLGYSQITVAAKVLAYALVLESAIILALDFKIVNDIGLSSFDVSIFSPSQVLVPGIGIVAIYAFNSMLGIEGTAIYQEEARDSAVTVPRATFVSLVVIGIFYIFTAWCLTSAIGAERIAAAAAEDPGRFLAHLTDVHLGKVGGTAVSILVITSAFAASLALFNNSARYLYALGRDGLLPSWMGKTHDEHRSPHVAVVVQGIAMVIIVTVSFAVGLDPLLNVSTALIGVGSVGLMTLLGLTAMAIPVFFVRQKRFGIAFTLAPFAGGVVIIAATYVAFTNYSALTGVDSVWINSLSNCIFVAFAIGVVQALWIKVRNPRLYARIGSTRVEG